MSRSQIIKDIESGVTTRIERKDLSGRLNLFEAFRLASALRHNPKVEVLHLQHTKLRSGQLQDIIEGLTHNYALREIDLSRMPLHGDTMRCLARVLRNKPALESVALGYAQMQDEDIAVLLDALSTCPNLKYIDIRSNNMGPESSKALAEMLPKLRRLERFNADLSNMRKEWQQPIAEVLHLCRAMSGFNVASWGNTTQEHGASFEGCLRAGDCPNLVGFAPAGPVMADRVEKNRQHAELLAREILRLNGDFSSLDAKRLALLTDMLPAIRRITPPYFQTPFLKFEQYVSSLPRADKSFPLTAASLTGEVGGRCTLENAFFWQELDKTLPYADETVTLDLLLQKNREGISYLTIGLTSAPDIVIPALNAHGISLGEELMTHGHTPSAHLQALLERNAASHLFTCENWKNRSHFELRRVYSAIPPEHRQQIPNYHSLMAELSSTYVDQHERRGR